MKNRLNHETSPYLLQHADNPVAWYPWCEEAFVRAKAEDKPVFLSIGYSTCHWCHVMAHESFEDEEIAEILNRNFVAVKVDKEERPDIDSVYMSVCQALTGSGGWPTTIFLTPDQKPFFAGTYFPKTARFGQVGLKELLLAVHEKWKHDREELLQSADSVIEHLKRQSARTAATRASNPTATRASNPTATRASNPTATRASNPTATRASNPTATRASNPTATRTTTPQPPSTRTSTSPYISPRADEAMDGQMIEDAFELYKQSFDEQFGGFGAAPKFPTPHNLLFLMRYYQTSRDQAAMNMVEKTLIQMYRGGMFDHIGGGFSRYSTDRYFLAPHFEKMLYDNALLILAYCSAYQITKSPVYRKVAEKTASYIKREMTSAEGGFYSAQDADSEGVEGKYYLLEPSEVVRILGEQDGAAFNQFFDITEKGNFEGKNIPNLLKNSQIEETMETCLQSVYDYRKKRYALHLDDKILTSWNGLMIAAMCHLYRVTGNREYLKAAEDAQTFVLEKLYKDGTLYISYRNGRRSGKGLLDDYANEIFALLALYGATWENRYLEQALVFFERVISDFYDEEQGGFFLYGREHEQLILRPKETYDGAVFSGNSAMAYNLVQLYWMTGDERLGALAERQLEFMSAEAAHYPVGYAMFLVALLDYLDPPEKVTVVLKDYERPSDLPCRIPLGAVVRVLDRSTEEYPLKDDKMTFYVCRGHACQPPTNEL